MSAVCLKHILNNTNTQSTQWFYNKSFQLNCRLWFPSSFFLELSLNLTIFLISSVFSSSIASIDALLLFLSIFHSATWDFICSFVKALRLPFIITWFIIKSSLHSSKTETSSGNNLPSTINSLNWVDNRSINCCTTLQSLLFVWPIFVDTVFFFQNGDYLGHIEAFLFFSI